MRFMSYNIQIGIVSARNPQWRPDLIDLGGIADVIASQNPDVVCLQEVDNNRVRSNYVDQARWLAERLGYAFAFAPAYRSNEPNGTQGEYGNAILTRHPIEEFQVIQLEQGPAAADQWVEPRCCFAATLAGDPPVRVVGLHMSTRAEDRAPAFRQLCRLVESWRAEPLVVMGDFNAEPAEMEESGLNRILYNIFSDVPTPTFPNGTKAKVTIDHMLVSGHWVVEAAWVVSERLGRSDHNPLVADLRLKAGD